MNARGANFRQLPASLSGLDLMKAGRAIIKTGGNITKAAISLGVPPEDLRLATRANPRLIDAALEAEEQALDEAEAVIRKGLKSRELGRALEAAAHLLRNSDVGRERGWGKRR
jgi:hypothetical protein